MRGKPQPWPSSACFENVVLATQHEEGFLGANSWFFKIVVSLTGNVAQ